MELSLKDKIMNIKIRKASVVTYVIDTMFTFAYA